MFRAVYSNSFPPFTNLYLELPPVPDKPEHLAEVHILTGINGTGKTRLLCALAAMLGQPEPLARKLQGAASPVTFQVTDTDPQHAPPNNTWSQFTVPAELSQAWQRQGSFVQTTAPMPAFACSAHSYVKDAQVKAMAELKRPDRAACLSFTRPEDTSTLLLQAIANLKLQAALNALDPASQHGRASQPALLMRALETALTYITGAAFSFQLRAQPSLVLQVHWGGTSLPFNLLPDGLRSLIGWFVSALVMMDLWLQGECDPTRTPAIFLLEDIENHLHPAWQRRILPAFQRLVPTAQIIVATQSPIVITSLNSGWIHPITMDKDRNAVLQPPVLAGKGDSYISVLENIMGVKEWYDPETEALLARFRRCRDDAAQGNASAAAEARELAAQIAQLSPELNQTIHREFQQLTLSIEPFTDSPQEAMQPARS